MPIENVSELSLDELLNVRVSIASRMPQVAAEAPGSVTVFTREQINRMAVSTVEELLNYVPGFQVTPEVLEGRMERITVRGLHSYASAGVLFLRDGVPYWQPYDGSISSFDRQISLKDIERVEVVRGPGSTLWGANASSGVVNLVTIKDHDSADVSIGSLFRRQASLNYHLDFGELKLSASAQAFSDEGFTFRNYTDKWGVTGNMKDPFRGYDISLRAEYKGLSLTYRDMSRVWTGFVNWQAQSDYNRNWSQRSYLDLSYVRQIGKGDLTVGLTYTDLAKSGFGLLVPKGTELIPGVLTLNDDFIGGPFVASSILRFHTDFAWRQTENNTFNIGFSASSGWIRDAYHFHSRNPETLADFGGPQALRGALNYVDENGSQSMVGLYAQDTLRLWKALVLTVGGRIDYNISDVKMPGDADRKNLIDFRFSPRLALAYSASADSTVKLMYGRSFRSPSISELTFSHNPIVSGALAVHDSLQPETVDTGELAFTQKLFSKLSATATGYVSNAKDLLQPGAPVTPADACFPRCSPGSRPLGNNESLLTSGVELEVKASPIAQLLFVGSYSHLFGAWTNGKRVDTEQGTNQFAADLSYAIGRLEADVSGYFRQGTVLVPKQGDYLVLSSRIGYRLIEHVKLSASAENILNSQYIGVTEWGLPNGAPARGRTVYATLQFE